MMLRSINRTGNESSYSGLDSKNIYSELDRLITIRVELEPINELGNLIEQSSSLAVC